LIGTVGRIPGEGDGPAVGQLGIKPFTVLSGMLDQKATTELFDVKGLPSTPPYLQALTLDDYVPGQGWVRDTRMAPGVAADQHTLPAAPGQQSSDPKTNVTISAVNWSDVWLPIYGMPANLQDISNDYRYDKDSGIVYSEKTRKPDTYVEQADLTVPTAGALRDAGSDYSQISRKYTRINGVDPKVENLARTITSNATDPFDQAQAIYNYFRAPGNGFTYSTNTGAKVTGDPLVDFLFHNKTGFCEQYASAMAVMLRTLGIPSRVGIGFTNGYTSGDHVVITSQDAHAWVEVYFPGYGWVTFDPTPLTDGRTQVPGFVNQTQDNGASENGSRRNPDKPNGNPTTAPKAPVKTIPAPESTVSAAGSGSTGIPVWQLATVLGLALAAGASTTLSRRGRAKAPDGGRGWSLVATVAWGLFAFFVVALLSWWLSVLVLVLGLAAAPSVIREWRRRRHHRLVVARGPGAADVAWHELLAESWDRGIELQRGDTLRVAANRMVREHGLDRDGQQSLRTLVGEVERSWYGAPPAPTAQTPTAPVVVDSFDRVRGSLRRNAPLGFWSKVLPRSVLRPMRRRRDRRDDEDVS
jgi:transglutaminase-like putative cysteine protease